MSFDHQAMAEAFRAPGNDTRQWITYGIIQPDTGDDHSVRFNDENGDPLGPGPMVDVKLEPSGIVVPCRVLMRTSGAGEGEWEVMGPGDEVLVAVPEGNERAGAIILGRCNNSADAWPSTVAGMDTTQNTISFKRCISPFVLETASSYLVRQSKTGAALSIDTAGAVMIASGDGHTIALNSSVVGMQLAGDTPVGMQVQVDSQTVQLFAGPTTLQIGASESELQTSGTFRIATTGVPPNGHAITTEQVLSLMLNLVCALNTTGAFQTAFSVAFAAGGPAVIAGLLTAVLAGAVAPNPIGIGGAPGGLMTATGMTGLVTAALAGQVPDLTGEALIPGVGKPGLLF